MRRVLWVLLSALLLGGLLLFAGQAAGSELYWSAPPDRGESILPSRPDLRVGMEVLVDGRPLRTVAYAGRTYLPIPRLGIEYELRVWNHGSRRIVAIVSVDGLSVINGQPASETHPGYIVDPGSSVLIRGWRRDRETVAAFSFEERAQSYASRVGRPENIGVIGLIAIEEMSWGPRLPVEDRESLAPAARKTLAELGGTGTGYGRDIDSRIHYLPFLRSNHKQTITIYYDTVAALRQAGVPVSALRPLPFPGDPEFVPPPPGPWGK
jgi:hypothetical protein